VVSLELAALLAVALVPMPIPRALPLFAVASISVWARGKAWVYVLRGPAQRAWIGAAAGLGALVLALLAGTPVVEALTGRSVQWPAFAMVRGNSAQLLAVIVVVGALAVVTELALRGWIVERVLELAPGRRALAIAAGALAEALLVEGDVLVRLGAALFGAALGWMYVAGGRNAVPPVCARLAFALGLVLAEWQQWIG
jgi:hypothetical protein